jgi:hypothetical protein
MSTEFVKNVGFFVKLRMAPFPIRHPHEAKSVLKYNMAAIDEN